MKPRVAKTMRAEPSQPMQVENEIAEEASIGKGVDVDVEVGEGAGVETTPREPGSTGESVTEG